MGALLGKVKQGPNRRSLLRGGSQLRGLNERLGTKDLELSPMGPIGERQGLNDRARKDETTKKIRMRILTDSGPPVMLFLNFESFRLNFGVYA